MSVPRVVVKVQASMLDDSFCYLRNHTFGAKVRMEFPMVPRMPESFPVLWFDGGATCNTNVYAVFACGCSRNTLSGYG